MSNKAQQAAVLLRINKRQRPVDSDDEESSLRMRKLEADFSIETEFVTSISHAVTVLAHQNPRKQRSADQARDRRWWTDGYEQWDDVVFKKILRIERATFEYILAEIRDHLIRQQTTMRPIPTTPACQLALTLYRLADGCTFTVLENQFGESISNCANPFNHVCRVHVSSLYDRYVRVPETDEEWEHEVRGFVENYEFPCVGAWDGFHVYISSKLKNFFSFKKRYTMTKMGLIGYNKRFLYAAVGAPGSTHDARLLR